MLRALTIVLAAVGCAVWVRRGGVRHVVVRGASMQPTLAPGDRLLLVRMPCGPRPGQLTVAPDPRVNDRLLLKRVHAAARDGVHVHGDNLAASTDSRSFGALPLRDVRGYAAWRYAPPDRVGRVR